MAKRKATMQCGSLTGCPTHKRNRQYKSKLARPTNKCPVCWACWLGDRLETSIYESDMEDLIAFSNAFTTVVKPSSIEYVETIKDD